MLTITIEVSNEGARTLLKELTDFGEHMNSKMAGEHPDIGGTAALGWVMGDKVRRAVQGAVDGQEAKFAAEARAARPTPPSIRDRRRPEARSA